MVEWRLGEVLFQLLQQLGQLVVAHVERDGLVPHAKVKLLQRRHRYGAAVDTVDVKLWVAARAGLMGGEGGLR
eukprot:SAG31_NODE_11939_length_983_cov_2.643665_1_plen_72_part_10